MGCAPHLTGDEYEVRKEGTWPRALGESGPELGWKWHLLHPSIGCSSPESQEALMNLGFRHIPESKVLGLLIPPHEAFIVHHLDPLGHRAGTPPEGLNKDRNEASRGLFLLAGPVGYHGAGHQLILDPCPVSPP